MTRRVRNLLPVLLALGLGAVCAADASAADLALKALPAPPPAAFSWTGFYAGVHAGHGSGEGNAASVDPGALLALFPGVNNLTSTASAPFTFGVDRSGWLGGLQAGYNWQTGHFVAGVEADVSAAGIRARESSSYALRPVFLVGDFDNYTGTVTVTQNVDYLGTLRGRLGYASHNWLFYATGGLAWAHVKASLDSTHVRLTNNFPMPGLPGALDGHASASGYKIGYAVGGGGEWAFTPHWSLKAEYLYLNLGRQLSLSIPGTSLMPSDIELHTFRIGLNRQFAP